MRLSNFLRSLSEKTSLFHISLAILVVVLFSFGYHKLNRTPIDPEVMEHIRNERPSDAHLLEKNRMQVLFMQERGWYFIALGALTLAIVLWMGLSHRRSNGRSAISYKQRLSEQLTRTVKDRLNFQERLRVKYASLTDHDLLVAEMLVDGLSSKEISAELNISPASANTARYRLRKRMSLPPEANLLDVLKQI